MIPEIAWASGWIVASGLGGMIAGALLFASAQNTYDKEAIEQGVIRLKGKLYRITLADGAGE